MVFVSHENIPLCQWGSFNAGWMISMTTKLNVLLLGLFFKEIHHHWWRSVKKIAGASYGWPHSQRVNQMFYLVRANIWRQLWVFSACWGHPSIAPGLISRLRYGGKMSDFVVAVLQVTCSSSRNNPAKPPAVWPGAFGGGIFSQAFPNQLPHANQVTISNLDRWGNRKGGVKGTQPLR